MISYPKISPIEKLLYLELAQTSLFIKEIIEDGKHQELLNYVAPVFRNSNVPNIIKEDFMFMIIEDKKVNDNFKKEVISCYLHENFYSDN